MKLTVPKVNILEDEGFSPEADIFLRKDFGERLASLVEKSNGNIVIALDAKWGEGKSTFIKMWQGYIEHKRDNKIKSIYFDAFANDYQKDPFLTLAAEMYELVKNKPQEKTDEFKTKAGNAVKSLARGAIKITVRAVSGGILDGSIVDSAEKDISDLLADQVDEIIADKLQNTTKDRLAISQFREYLEKLSAEEGRPIVFIVDELDRCRPDFALELVEQIKHLFSVPGITFLLVMNRMQLQESIKARYGSGVEATLYLQKFVNLWLSLPRKSDRYHDNGAQYVKHALNLMLDDGEQVANNDVIELLSELVKYLKPSFREIEQILSYFALIHNMAGNSAYYAHYQTMIAFICYLKASKPELISKIENESIDGKELIQMAGLPISFSDEIIFYHIEYLYNLIIFDLANKEERQRMLDEKVISFSGAQGLSKNIIKKVCGWLSEMSIK
ncbi:MAG: P-loop NTPase fold protein [Methylobacter sp.]|nr:P-loop NTPase fold protein [Methylobacter sp.]